MFNKAQGTKLLCINAMIAAVYALFTVLLAPISYGAVQFRLSEALCILPFFMPQCVWGLFIGCIIANIFSGNVFDIIFGSLATLFSVLCIAIIGRRGKDKGHIILACLMPVLFNSLVVGAVITRAYMGISLFCKPLVLLANCMYVALGELGVMLLVGFPLALFLKKRNFFYKL